MPTVSFDKFLKDTGGIKQPIDPEVQKKADQVRQIPKISLFNQPTVDPMAEAKSYGADLLHGYGEDAKNFSEQTQHSADLFNEAGKNTKDGQLDSFGTMIKKTGALLQGGLQNASTAVDSVFRPISEGVKHGVKIAADKISDSPMVQELAMTDHADELLRNVSGLQETVDMLSEKHPDSAKNVKSALNLLMVVLGEKAAAEAAAKANAGKTAGEAPMDPSIKLHQDNATIANELSNEKLLGVGDKTLTQPELMKLDAETKFVAPPKTPVAPLVPKPVPSEIMPPTDAGGGALRASQATTEAAAETVNRSTPLLIRSKIEDAANPIPKNIETVLRETPADKLDSYANLARNAVSDSKAQTPMEFAGGKATEALNHIQKDLSTTGELKSTILSQASVGRKPVGPIAIDFAKNVDDAFSSKMLVPGDEKLVTDLVNRAKALGPNPHAADVDQFIDYAQNKIYTSKRDLTVPVTDEHTAALRKLVGELNTNLKNELPKSYADTNSRYSDLIDIRNELNAKLGPDGERSGALMKRVFSPSDANTKKLFAQVKDETGIDLVNEAVLAKYVMETMGDARQASLLEQALGRGPAPITKSGAVTELYQQLKKIVQNPDANLRKARRMTIGGESTPAIAPAAEARPTSMVSPLDELRKPELLKGNKQGGYVTIRGKQIREFADFAKDDQEFLSKVADKIRAGEKVSLYDSKIARETLDQYGFTTPSSDKKFADVIINARDSSAGKAFDAQIDNNLKNTFKAPSNTASVVEPLRDEKGRFSGSRSVAK